MQGKKGILLMALGHPYYGMMAYNLALSLKYTAPEIPITLLCDDKGIQYLDQQKRGLFQRLLSCPIQYTTFRDRTNYVKPKVYLNHFTPYDQTLYLDVDMIMTPKKSIKDLFDECSGIPFTIQNRGHLDLGTSEDLNSKFMIWATSGEIKDAFGFDTGKLFNLSSELIYFENNEKSEKLFKRAQELFESPKVKYVDFAGGVPDELPFAVAMIEQNLYPHKDRWRPIFWEAFDNLTPQEKELYMNYYGVSLGGNIIPKYTKKLYQNLVTFYAKHAGVTIHWSPKDKRTFLTDRQTI